MGGESLSGSAGLYPEAPATAGGIPVGSLPLLEELPMGEDVPRGPPVALPDVGWMGLRSGGPGL